MNPINVFKKWFLNFLLPYIEGTNKKNDSSQEKRFRVLFKKRKSTLIVGVFVLCFIVFGIGKSFSFIAWLIASSPFFVIFWSSFGEQLRFLLKSKKKPSSF